MNNTELQKKDVSEEILEKVMRLAKSRTTFTTKDILEAYPDNQEYLLKYAIFNLRLDGKIFKFGEKKGAYYSITNAVSDELKTTENNDQPTWHELILREARKFPGWFKRTDLPLENYSAASVINTLKELIELGTIEKQGEMRWTQYRLINSEPIQEELTPRKQDLKNNILSYIKKQKVVTIPMIVSELEIQRYQVVPIVDLLVKEEEIWHEGLGRGSKYIYKSVTCDEVEKIVDELHGQRKISQRIDELSDFLCSDDITAVSIGRKKDSFNMKFFSNGDARKVMKFNTLDELINQIHILTEMR